MFYSEHILSSNSDFYCLNPSANSWSPPNKFCLIILINRRDSQYWTLVPQIKMMRTETSVRREALILRNSDFLLSTRQFSIRRVVCSSHSKTYRLFPQCSDTSVYFHKFRF